MTAKTIYTVVVADDEDVLRDALCTMVPWQELGFALVGSASNGLDALQLVEKLEPDLLLTDIRMPFISGIELARQVREVRPAMNIAFLSGYDDFEYAKQAIQYNIISYMLKPLTIDGIAAELRRIHQKIDDRFSLFRQAAEQQKPVRQDQRARLSDADGAGRVCRAGPPDPRLRGGAGPAAGRRRPSPLCGDGADPAGQSGQRPHHPPALPTR